MRVADVRSTAVRVGQIQFRFANDGATAGNPLSLGKYPLVTPLGARGKKIDALRLLCAGIDPSAQRKRDSALAVFPDRNSFGAVAEEWFVRNRSSWAAKHAKDTWSRLELHILPKLGERPIAEILPLEMLSAIQRIEANGATHMSHIDAKRGSEAMLRMGLLERFRRALMRDCLGAYNLFTACWHFYCNAHLQRELVYVLEQMEQEWAGEMIDLLLEAKKLREREDARSPGQRRVIGAAARQRLQTRYREIVIRGLKASPEPPPQ